jgi:hypothetical protein
MQKRTLIVVDCVDWLEYLICQFVLTPFVKIVLRENYTSDLADEYDQVIYIVMAVCHQGFIEPLEISTNTRLAYMVIDGNRRPEISIDGKTTIQMFNCHDALTNVVNALASELNTTMCKYHFAA